MQKSGKSLFKTEDSKAAGFDKGGWEQLPHWPLREKGAESKEQERERERDRCREGEREGGRERERRVRNF